MKRHVLTREKREKKEERSRKRKESKKKKERSWKGIGWKERNEEEVEKKERGIEGRKEE